MNLTVGLIINLLLPALGLGLYLLLCLRMEKLQIAHAPYLSFFMLFLSYGGYLLVILTELFWAWSAMASIGVAFLVFVSPLLLIIAILRLWPRRQISKFHRFALNAAAAYFPLTAISVMYLRS